MIPERDELPAKYHYLLAWYESEYCGKQSLLNEEDDPILQMWGVGKEIWADTNADDYVRDLRSNWYGTRMLESDTPNVDRYSLANIFWDTNLFIYLVEGSPQFGQP